MEPLLSPVFGMYDWSLVSASLAIAIVASYTALDVAGRLRLAQTVRQQTLWLVSGSLAMGVGIWSMHFVGMLAFQLPMAVHYDLNTTLLSLFWALIASGIGLYVMSRSTVRFSLLVGGLCMGLAIVAMHYTGMAAMQLPGEVHYSWLGVGASVVIALVSAYGAAWLSLRLGRSGMEAAGSGVPFTWQSLSSAIIMGCGIGGMHYTAMTSTQFWMVNHSVFGVSEQTPDFPIGSGGLSQPSNLPSITSAGLAVDVALGAIVILVIALAISTFERMLDRQRVREQTLSESEMRFRLLIDRLPTGVLLVDAGGRILSCNPMAAKLLGTSVEALQGQIFHAGLPTLNPNDFTLGQDLMPLQQILALGEPDATVPDRPMVNRGVGNLLKANFTGFSSSFSASLGWDGGETGSGGATNRSAGQSWTTDRTTNPQWRLANTILSLNEGEQRRWLLVNADPILNEDQQVERVVCSLTDITDRRLAELALQKTARRETTIARVIQRMRRTLELQTILDTTTSELQQIIECDRVLVYRFEPNWSGRVVSEAVVPGWTPVYNNTTIERIAVDRPECIIKTIDSQNLLIQDTYLQDTQGGSYQTTRSCRCVSDIYAYGFDDCYLRLLEALEARAYIIVPIFCREQLWGLLACYQNGQPRSWTEVEVASVVRIAEQFGVAVQQAELLAKTQQQTTELLAAKEEADRANRAKSHFLAQMSHELRTPLNAILGFTQLMARDPSLSLTHRQQTNIVNRSGEHLLGLINSILDMSKIEAAQMTLQLERFDLHRLLDTLQDLLTVKAESKGLVLLFERSATLPQFVITDQNRLRQILLNLLGNALKFTDRGRVILTARELSTTPIGERSSLIAETPPTRETDPAAIGLEFNISDTGPGLSTEEIAQLFRPFEQTAVGQRSGQGTGLGLSISREFARLLGGDISVYSQPQTGATFTVTIQAQRAEISGTIDSASQQPILRLAPGQPAYVILVADDHADSRALLTDLLNQVGFQTITAINGQMAVELWQQHHPQAIFMDMKMPGLDGYAASRLIKSQPGGHQTLIIALTASAFDQDRAAILAAGCDDLICKPFNFTDLLELLGQKLGVQYLYQAPAEPEPNTAPIDTDPHTLLAQLASLPDPWQQQFRSAVTRGSDSQALQLLETLPDSANALRQVFSQWIDGLRFDRVLELLDEAQSAP